MLTPTNYGKANFNELCKAHFDDLYKEIYSNKQENIVMMN
jgi:hypothetical protein